MEEIHELVDQLAQKVSSCCERRDFDRARHWLSKAVAVAERTRDLAIDNCVAASRENLAKHVAKADAEAAAAAHPASREARRITECTFFTSTGDLATNYYSVFNVQRNATINDIRIAYKRLYFLVHPDRAVGIPRALEASKTLSDGYDVLKTPLLREAHDARIDGDTSKAKMLEARKKQLDKAANVRDEQVDEKKRAAREAAAAAAAAREATATAAAAREAAATAAAAPGSTSTGPRQDEPSAPRPPSRKRPIPSDTHRASPSSKRPCSASKSTKKKRKPRMRLDDSSDDEASFTDCSDTDVSDVESAAPPKTAAESAAPPPAAPGPEAHQQHIQTMVNEYLTAETFDVLKKLVRLVPKLIVSSTALKRNFDELCVPMARLLASESVEVAEKMLKYLVSKARLSVEAENELGLYIKFLEKRRGRDWSGEISSTALQGLYASLVSKFNAAVSTGLKDTSSLYSKAVSMQYDLKLQIFKKSA